MYAILFFCHINILKIVANDMQIIVTYKYTCLSVYLNMCLLTMLIAPYDVYE